MGMGARALVELNQAIIALQPPVAHQRALLQYAVTVRDKERSPRKRAMMATQTISMAATAHVDLKQAFCAPILTQQPRRPCATLVEMAIFWLAPKHAMTTTRPPETGAAISARLKLPTPAQRLRSLESSAPTVRLSLHDLLYTQRTHHISSLLQYLN